MMYILPLAIVFITQWCLVLFKVSFYFPHVVLY